VPHKIRGEVVYCFVKSKYGLEVDENRLEIELKELVAKRISKVFIPERIIVVPDLPKTRSGKIMRRILRAILLDQDLGDVSSLENPETIESLKRKIKI
jgi:acetyl-CoA synthetase